MLKHRLQIAEYVFILASIIGWGVAVWSGRLIYAAVPVTMTLLLSLLNRWRLEQQMKRRLTAAVHQLQRQLVEESHTLNTQQLEDAIASLKTDLLNYFSQIESPDLQSSALKIVQYKGRLTNLEESFNSVVQYLNTASLPSRVERLEEAIASVTAEIARIYRQLPDTKQTRRDALERDLPTRQATAVPVLNPQNSTPPSTETIAVEEPHELSLPAPTWSFVHSLMGHSDWVHALAISPDGKTLASGSFDKTIKLWHLLTGELMHTLAQHAKGVLCLAISPDGQLLASGGFDETIRLWCLDTGELIYTLKGHKNSVRAIAITPDNQTLISGSVDETIKLWRLDTGELLGNLTKTAGQVAAIALSSDGQTLASGGNDGMISLRLLDTTDGEIKPSPAITLTGNLSSICSLAMTPDGEILAAGCSDGTIKLWQLGTLEPLHVIQGHSAPVMSVNFALETSTLLSGSADGTIKIWHLETGQELSLLADDSAASVMAVAISLDGQLIVSGGADSTIKIWQQD